MQILTITIIVFLSIVLVTFGIYYALVTARGSVRREIKRKLKTIVLNQPTDEIMPPLLKEEILSEIPPLNRFLYKLQVAHNVEGLLDQSDVQLKVGQYFLLVGVLFCIGLLIGMLAHRGFIFAFILAAVFGFIPYFYLNRRRKERVKKFTAQFPDALDMIARSLRAGHSFTSAMQIVYQEMPDPVSKVFRIAYDEQNLGLSLSEAMNNMTNRIKSLDLNFFVTSVNISRDTGGNLAEVFEKLGHTIRERFRIIGQLRVYTAQGKLSGYILAGVPIVLAIAIWIINPTYLDVLFQTKLGHYLLAGAVVLQIMGFFIIRKIIDIKI